MIQEGRGLLKRSYKKCPKCGEGLYQIDKEGELFWCKKCDVLFDKEQLEKEK